MNKNAGNNVLSLHKSLMDRRAINDVLKKLNGGKKVSFDDLDVIGDDLNGYGKQVSSVIINNFLEITDEKVLMRYLYLIEHLNHDEFISPLIYTVIKRELSDSFKANAINALYSFDVDISNPVFAKIIEDSDNMLYSFNEQFFDKIEKDEDIFISALSWFAGLAYHKKMVILNKVKETESLNKIVFLEIIANVRELDLALHAINILGTTKLLSSVHALKRIAKEHREDKRGTQALRVLKKLRLCGVHDEPAGQKGMEPKPPDCYVSLADCNGNYVLWVAASDAGRPPLEVLCVLINEDEGVIDCFGSSQMTKKEFNTLIRKAKDEDYFIKIDYDYCIKLVKDALFKNKKNDSHMPLEFLYRKKIFKCALNAKKHTPDFSGYDIEELRKDKSLLAKTPAINDICGIRTWMILSGDIFEYAEKYLQIQKRFKSTAGQLKVEKLFENIFYNLVMPELGALTKRLFFAADVLRFDMKNKRHVDLILCAAANLADPKQKPSKNPFITNFIMVNIKNAVEIFKQK